MEQLLHPFASGLDVPTRFYLVPHTFKHLHEAAERWNPKIWPELPPICKGHSALPLASSRSQRGHGNLKIILEAFWNRWGQIWWNLITAKYKCYWCIGLTQGTSHVLHGVTIPPEGAGSQFRGAAGSGLLVRYTGCSGSYWHLSPLQLMNQIQPFLARKDTDISVLKTSFWLMEMVHLTTFMHFWQTPIF